MQHKKSLVEIFQAISGQKGPNDDHNSTDNQNTNGANIGDKVKAGIDKIIDYLS
jgi:hypothetical protein